MTIGIREQLGEWKADVCVHISVITDDPDKMVDKLQVESLACLKNSDFTKERITPSGLWRIRSVKSWQMPLQEFFSMFVTHSWSEHCYSGGPFHPSEGDTCDKATHSENKTTKSTETA